MVDGEGDEFAAVPKRGGGRVSWVMLGMGEGEGMVLTSCKRSLCRHTRERL